MTTSDDSSTEAEIIRSLIDARKSVGITQQELSRRTGISQCDISRLETGNANPSLRTLLRLADGLGKKISIKFE